MSEATATPPPIVRPPASSRREASLRFGGLGLLVGLLIASVLIIWDQRPAGALTHTFTCAREALLHQQLLRQAWPAEGALTPGRADLVHPRFNAFHAAVARCPVAGVWSFRAKTGEGGPVITFEPAEPGRAFERVMGVVDRWMDDGQPAKGDLRYGPAGASLKLSPE